MKPLDLHDQQAALQMAICELRPADGLLRQGSGLAVYQDAYRARLLAALRDNFLVLQRAMGDADFDALGLAYLQVHPSGHASIRWFGDRLAEFMDTSTELSHPSLADIARMDWALRAAFDARDQPALAAEALRAVAPEDWGGLRFELHPSVRIQSLRWAVEPAWRALRAYEKDSGQEVAPALDPPEPLAHWLLVWRQELETRWRSLPPLEARLLQALAAGSSFAGICALMADDIGAEQAAVAVVTALQQWLAEGLLAGISPA